MQTETMKNILEHAYANPSEQNFFYSANSAETGSKRLNELGCWDWTPAKSVGIPGVNTCMFPLAMGCERVEIDSGKEWIKPLITCPEDVDKLEVPDIYSGRSGEVLENLITMLKELPEGQIIRDPDTQSPLGVAELMWDESFYFALLESPASVHKLLEKITEFIIKFVREVQRLAGDRFNGAGFPCIWATPAGTMVADDTMSLISPEMHLEFSVPYLNELGDQCGPLFYHSCSWRKPYFDNIHQIRNVKAYNWNPGNSDDPAEIIREFSGHAVLAPHLVIDMHKDNDVLKFSKELGISFANEVEFLEYMMDAMTSKSCLYFWFSNVVQKGEIIDRIYDLIHQRGYSPQAKEI